VKKYHNIADLRFDKHYLLIKVDGKAYRIDLRVYSRKLASADERTKMNFVVSPSGYGIHWPELDEDLSIDGMIKSANRLFSLA
jgi:hypothetical protein